MSPSLTFRVEHQGKENGLNFEFIHLSREGRLPGTALRMLFTGDRIGAAFLERRAPNFRNK